MKNDKGLNFDFACETNCTINESLTSLIDMLDMYNDDNEKRQVILAIEKLQAKNIIAMTKIDILMAAMKTA
jgi:hypothetical protein